MVFSDFLPLNLGAKVFCVWINNICVIVIIYIYVISAGAEYVENTFHTNRYSWNKWLMRLKWSMILLKIAFCKKSKITFSFNIWTVFFVKNTSPAHSRQCGKVSSLNFKQDPRYSCNKVWVKTLFFFPLNPEPDWKSETFSVTNRAGLILFKEPLTMHASVVFALWTKHYTKSF